MGLASFIQLLQPESTNIIHPLNSMQTAKKIPAAKKSSSGPKPLATGRGKTTTSRSNSLPMTASSAHFSTGCTKERLEKFCEKSGKARPVFKSEKVSAGSRKFIGKVYIQQTCGWTSGEPKNTKAEAEEDAAAKLVSKLGLTLL